jgi:hypothetical protein
MAGHRGADAARVVTLRVNMRERLAVLDQVIAGSDR